MSLFVLLWNAVKELPGGLPRGAIIRLGFRLLNCRATQIFSTLRFSRRKIAALRIFSWRIEPPMSEPSSVTARMKLRAVAATLTAGLIAAILDIIAAFLVYGRLGAPPERILQGIASGILGPSAFEGGSKTAVLGLALHFIIALGAATMFYTASRKLKFLTRHAVISGFLFGIVVYFFMQDVVLPLSAYQKGAFSLSIMLVGVVVHMFCVGLPISLTIRRFPI